MTQPMFRQWKNTIQDEGSLSGSNSCISLGLTCPCSRLHVPQMSMQDRDQGFIHQMPRARREELHQVVYKLEIGKGEGESV